VVVCKDCHACVSCDYRSSQWLAFYVRFVPLLYNRAHMQFPFSLSSLGDELVLVMARIVHAFSVLDLECVYIDN
jgi:hypothetical protein